MSPDVDRRRSIVGPVMAAASAFAAHDVAASNGRDRVYAGGLLALSLCGVSLFTGLTVAAMYRLPGGQGS